jgi:DNA-binding transcriptional MocR family regulator
MQHLSLDPQSATPLVDQIVNALAAQIDDRILRPGMRLMPIRRFSEAHEVSRFTVVEAYDRLVARGFVTSRRGAGFYVAARASSPTSAAPEPEEIGRALDTACLMRAALAEGPDKLRASAGWLPDSWMGQEELDKQWRALLRSGSLSHTGYGLPEGFAPLREHLSFRLGEAGIAAPASQILLTLGATHALDLIARHLLRPGDTVFVDDPGYFTLFGNLRLHGAKLVGIPWNANGPDVAELERLAAEHRPKVYFTQSVLHNPTGASLTPATAFRILQCAEKFDFHLVEDDIYSDFFEGAATRLAAMDQLRRVIYVNSFSKTLSGNLRVGYIAAHPQIIEALLDIKVLSLLATPQAGEELVLRMLTEGHYRKHLERLRGRVTDAAIRATRMLEQLGLAPYVAHTGGMFMWIRLPGMEDSAELASLAAREGIFLTPGTLFRPQNQASPFIRLNVAYANDVRLVRFLEKQLPKPGQ